RAGRTRRPRGPDRGPSARGGPGRAGRRCSHAAPRGGAVTPGPNGERVVKVEGLHKSFGDLEVLRGIDMEVGAGQVVWIFGRGGSGEWTGPGGGKLRGVNFLADATAGAIEVSGIRLEGGHRTHHTREQIRTLRTHCGMVFQQFN